MYDLEAYTKKFEELTTAGDLDGAEQFILNELPAIDMQYYLGGGGCPSCRSQEKEDLEAAEWLRERITAQTILRNDLIRLYHVAGRWDDCMAVFDQLMVNLEDAGLLEAPLHGRILLNRAMLEQELGRFDAALADAEHAKACLETAPEIAPDALRQANETIDACKASLGK